MTRALPVDHPVWARGFARVATEVGGCDPETATAIGDAIVEVLRMAGIAYLAQTPEAVELAAAREAGR